MLIPMIGGGRQDFFDATTTYGHPNFSGTRGEVLSDNYRVVLPCDGWATRLAFRTTVSPPVTKAFYFAIQVNDTSVLSASIINPALTGLDPSKSGLLSAGSTIRTRATAMAGAGAASDYFGWHFIPKDKGHTPFMGCGGNGTGTGYLGVNGHFFSAAESDVMCVVPVAGKFKWLYLRTPDGVGLTANQTFTLRKNSVDTALTATVVAPATTASDLVNEVSVAAGDNVAIKRVATVAEAVSWGVVFVPDDLKTIWIPLCRSIVNLGNNKYNYFNGGLPHLTTSCWQNTNRYTGWAKGPSITGIALGLETAPSVGTSRTITLQVDGANTNVHVTVSGTDTFGIATGFNVIPVDFAYMSLIATLSGSPAASRGSVAVLAESPVPVLKSNYQCVPRMAPAKFIDV